MSREPTPQPVANPWSEPINGLSGRLQVEFEDLNPGLRHAIYLELRNESLHSISVMNQPRVQAELFHSTGRSAVTSGFVVSGPLPNAVWAAIPRDAYIGLRLDMQTVGVPTREHGLALIAVGGKAWKLNVGRYVLQIDLAFEHEDNGPQDQWVGMMTVPPAEIVVTAQMLATR